VFVFTVSQNLTVSSTKKNKKLLHEHSCTLMYCLTNIDLYTDTRTSTVFLDSDDVLLLFVAGWYYNTSQCPPQKNPYMNVSFLQC